jgi:hypothetical protein
MITNLMVHCLLQSAIYQDFVVCTKYFLFRVTNTNKSIDFIRSLNGNRFTGPLPSEIANLHSLWELYEMLLLNKE